ncbi:putative non-specific protein-tyrosine kinase RLK-Pelle-DLSV family [Helianthus anomalus]
MVRALCALAAVVSCLLERSYPRHILIYGLLADGNRIAVKQLLHKSIEGISEFLNEVTLLTALNHPNLVKLHGSCVEGNQLSLIYEYMENNSLGHALSGKDSVTKEKLTWPVTLNICLGVAQGLVYLHENDIIHRDVKPDNILLDENMVPKVADLGISKLLSYGRIRNPVLTNEIAGTCPKADVYSFGITALELVTREKNSEFILNSEYSCLVEKARAYMKKGRLLELIDVELGPSPADEALTILNVALLCTHELVDRRPDMSLVVELLEGRTYYQDLLNDMDMDTLFSKPVDRGETSRTRDETSIQPAVLKREIEEVERESETS